MVFKIKAERNKKYPKIKNYCKNKYYSEILQNLYCGDEGEVLSFLQLRYHLFLLDFFNENVFKSLQKISLDDLKHQELLANAIQMTAGNPKYCSAAGKWLSSRQIEYVKDTKQIIKLNIDNKERAIINYKIAISKIDNSQIKNLLSSILNDEEEHLKILKDIKM